jgi:hypothetical protein
VLTFIGVAVSLVWNFLNRRRTEKIAKDVRADAIAHDEWKYVRDRIESAISDFDLLRLDFSTAIIDCENLRTLKAKIRSANQLLVQKSFVIETALHLAAISPFASGADWDHLKDDAYDSVVSAVDEIYRQKTIAAAGYSTNNVNQKLIEFRDRIQQRIDIETGKHVPLR